MENNFKNILIFGSTGQVGSNLISFLKNKSLTLPTRNDADFSSPETVKQYLKNLTSKLDIIINASAYTAVDNAEKEKDICNNINHKSVAIIAKYCFENNVPLIHYSTDYVYNGNGSKSFKEDDSIALAPLSIYGKTKLAGDEAIQNSGCNYIILRTSWVYNHKGNNFVNSIIRLASEKEELKIVSDQIGSPTYAYDLADVTIKIISKLSEFSKFPSGIYHACPSEQISWYEFAGKIINIADDARYPIKVKNILPIASSEYPTLAKRPLNSRLSVEKLYKVFGIKFPDINSSLKKSIQQMV